MKEHPSFSAFYEKNSKLLPSGGNSMNMNQEKALDFLINTLRAEELRQMRGVTRSKSS